MKVTLLTMCRVSFSIQSNTRTISLFAVLATSLLIGCDAVQLCGEYVCVAYQNECEHTHNCTKPRQCEAAGSIRDRAPRIINQLRDAQRSCGGASIALDESDRISINWDETLAGVSVSHARDMANNQFESFVGTNGLSTAERVSLVGIGALTVFESVTAGPQTTAEAINIWLGVNTDCKQLIHVDVTRIGMACAVPEYDNTGPYWSLILAGAEP